MRMRVSELWIPPRCPLVSAMGVPTVRSLAWCMKTVPSGMRCETIARATRAYARRQYGWFTRDPRILWIDVASDEAAAETAGRILGRLDSAR